ncbi:hypothetical protein [Pedobacter sp. UYEF25]
MREPEFRKDKNEILLVDDDINVLSRHKDVLKLLNPISISTFLSTSLPLEYISLPQKKDSMFLILISMPIADVRGMIEHLKTHPLAYSIWVIMVSYSPDNIKREADFGMVIDYINKPISEEQLLSVFLKTPSLNVFLAETNTSICPKLD